MAKSCEFRGKKYGGSTCTIFSSFKRPRDIPFLEGIIPCEIPNHRSLKNDHLSRPLCPFFRPDLTLEEKYALCLAEAKKNQVSKII